MDDFHVGIGHIIFDKTNMLCNICCNFCNIQSWSIENIVYDFKDLRGYEPIDTKLNWIVDIRGTCSNDVIIIKNNIKDFSTYSTFNKIENNNMFITLPFVKFIESNINVDFHDDNNNYLSILLTKNTDTFYFGYNAKIFTKNDIEYIINKIIFARY